MLPYRSRLDRLDPARDLCHFYLDDYRFEAVWNRPAPGARHVAGYFATCSPDFSLYPDWPLAAQIWNTYRSRWLARYWQAGGLRVIPTLNWSDAASFAFCFDGIPSGQILTIAVADLRRPHVERRFRAGLEAMLARLRPRQLLVYGRLPYDPGCPVIEVRPDWAPWRRRPSRSAHGGAGQRQRRRAAQESRTWKCCHGMRHGVRRWPGGADQAPAQRPSIPRAWRRPAPIGHLGGL